MSTAGDAERLLAAALRAQAASTATSATPATAGGRQPAYAVEASTGSKSPSAGGTNTTDSVAAAPEPGTTPDRLASWLPLGATLLLAILLGLAMGALVGLITLL